MAEKETVEKWIDFFTILIKKVGFSGFIVITFLGIFLFIFSNKQQERFIDTYILFRNTGNNPLYCSLFILFLIVIIVILAVFYNKDMKLKKEENNRIGKEKSELMEICLKQKLSTSD